MTGVGVGQFGCEKYGVAMEKHRRESKLKTTQWQGEDRKSWATAWRRAESKGAHCKVTAKRSSDSKRGDGKARNMSVTQSNGNATRRANGKAEAMNGTEPTIYDCQRNSID